MFRLKKIGKGLVSGLLLFCICLQVQASDITESEQKKQELQQQQQAAKQEAEKLRSELQEIVNEMRATEQAMTKKEEAISKTEEELVEAKVSERQQAQRMVQRVRYLYENGNINLFEVLLKSKNLSDFISKAEYVAMVSAYDTKMLDNYKATVEDIEKKEAKLQKDYEKLGTLQAQLTSKQTKVENLLSEKQTQLATIASSISDLDTLIANAKEAERRRREAEEAKRRQREEAEKKKREEAAAKKEPAASGDTMTQTKPVVSGNGYFTHPCPGMSYQSSYFGEVRAGIGDPTPHKGNDYAAASGTPIYAAAAGTVIIAGYSNSAGNWVVIDHGNGLVTKYMHMYASPLVASGQKVVKGQQIGGVGTTGQSTGNHLHFQVEQNGVAVSPDQYL